MWIGAVKHRRRRHRSRHPALALVPPDGEGIDAALGEGIAAQLVADFCQVPGLRAGECGLSFVRSGLRTQRRNEMAKLLFSAQGFAAVKLILHTYTYHNGHDTDSRIV